MKKQGFKNMSVVFIAVLITLSSCQKDDKELAVEFETIEFAVNPTETKIVSIYSNTEWVVEIQQAGTWLSVTPTSGKNDDILTLTAQVNDDFAERYATITLSGTGVEDKTISIMQQGDKTKDVILLEERHYIGYWLYKFEYDEQHRLTKRYEYNDIGTLKSTMTLTYEDDGDLKSVLWVNPNGYTELSGPVKDGNKISFRGVMISRYEIELNTEGLPESLTHYWEASMSGMRSTTEYTYTWVNRNLTKADYIVTGVRYSGEEYEESGETTYTYDDKKSPFYHCTTPRWFWTWYYFADITACSLNNLISSSSENETVNYTYNEDGFLATEKRGNNTEIIYTYKRIPGTGNSE
jgi:hypothetical protein